MSMVRVLAVVALVGAAAMGRAQEREPGYTKASADQVERLELPFTLAQLTGRVEELFAVDRPLMLERRWRVIADYYGFKAAKCELVLLRQRRDNLRALWQLAAEQADAALVEDAQVLQANNALLDAELTLLRTETACRERLLDILECCLVEVTTDGTREAAAAEGPVRERK